MKVNVALIGTSIFVLSGCASMVGGSQTPQDLMTKDPFGKYQTRYNLVETFDCLNRWVSAKNAVGFRREVNKDESEGHMFWKDGLGWVNWTYHFKRGESQNNLTIYRSANVAGTVDYLKVAARACAETPNSWPDSNF